MKQYEYPLSAFSNETILLGYEASNPRLTRNYNASDILSGGGALTIYNSNGVLVGSGDRIIDQSGKKIIYLNGNVLFGSSTSETSNLFRIEVVSSIAGIYVKSTTGSSFNGNSTDGRLFTGSTLNGTGLSLKAPFNELYDNGNPTSVLPSSVIFELRSTSKGFLGSRMTFSQMNAITSPVVGLEVYVTDSTEGKYVYKSTGWTLIG